MEMRFIAADCKLGGCPTLYATDRDTVVVQGFLITDPSALATLHLPPDESAVEIPRSLIVRAAAEL